MYSPNFVDLRGAITAQQRLFSTLKMQCQKTQQHFLSFIVSVARTNCAGGGGGGAGGGPSSICKWFNHQCAKCYETIKNSWIWLLCNHTAIRKVAGVFLLLAEPQKKTLLTEHIEILQNLDHDKKWRIVGRHNPLANPLLVLSVIAASTTNPEIIACTKL
jgi:hypothetical protein